MAIRLSSGAGLVSFDRLDSTSLEAKRRAAEGERGPVWFLALEQTGGYGRRGTAWRQAPGDFAATLLFEPAAPAARFGEISFIAGLAVAAAARGFAPAARLGLKWPNDVLLEGGKLAGILLERAAAAEPARLALGVGVNIVSAPSDADYPTARLLDHLAAEAAPSPEAFAMALDAAFFDWLGRWRAEGFAPVRSAWLEMAARLGEEITVRLPDGEARGFFESLDEDGALVLNCGGTRRRLSAGSIMPAARTGG